jgi:hypothetical protein
VQKLSPALEPLLVGDLVRMAFEEGASDDAPTDLRWYYGRVVKVLGVDSDLCDIAFDNGELFSGPLFHVDKVAGRSTLRRARVTGVPGAVSAVQLAPHCCSELSEVGHCSGPVAP